VTSLTDAVSAWKVSPLSLGTPPCLTYLRLSCIQMDTNDPIESRDAPYAFGLPLQGMESCDERVLHGVEMPEEPIGKPFLP